MTSDTSLDRIRSPEKLQELLNVLHSEDPDANSRLWLAGFLKFVGYSLEEICDLIDKEASWSNYDAFVTYNQVRSLFRRHGSPGRGARGTDSPRGVWIKHEDWLKHYGKRMCTLHFVSCVECPDNMGVGMSCRGRI